VSEKTIDGVPLALIEDVLAGMASTEGRRDLRPRLRALLAQCVTPLVDGTSAEAKLALVPDQVVGRVHHDPLPVRAYLNSLGRTLPDNAPLYARPAETRLRYVRVPSRKDPKYHEEWPEIEGGPVFDGVTYCNDLFEALKRYNVIAAETMPEGAVEYL
jgi:hypothetical protein